MNIINANKINIQERFAPFLTRNITPIIAGITWIEDNNGYRRAIDTANAFSPCMSSYAAKTDGIKRDKDNVIANNQTFLPIDLRTGFREMNKNAVINGYEPI